MIPTFTLADRLRKARDVRGLSRDELGARIDMSRNALMNYELGATAPKFSVVEKWAEVTDVPITWLLWGDDNAPQDPIEDAGRAVLAEYREELRALRDSNPQPSVPCTRVLSLVSPPPSLDDTRRAKESIARRVQRRASLEKKAA